MLTFHNHQWEISFIFFSLIAILLARAVNIYPLAFLINLSRSKKNKIELNMQHLMFFSGLRGAMAFALAIRNTSSQARRLILTTTLVIVIITVILCGGLTSKMLVWLKIRTVQVEEDHCEMPIDQSSDIESENKNKCKKMMRKFGLFSAWHSFDNWYQNKFFKIIDLLIF